MSRDYPNLTITLLRSPNFSEQFATFWNTFGGFIGFVGAGFVPGLSAYAAYLCNR